MLNLGSECHSSGSCTLYNGYLIKKTKNKQPKPEENKSFNFLISLPDTDCEAWKYFEHFSCFLMKCYYNERRMLQPSCCCTQRRLLCSVHHTPAHGEAPAKDGRQQAGNCADFHFFVLFLHTLPLPVDK